MLMALSSSQPLTRLSSRSGSEPCTAPQALAPCYGISLQYSRSGDTLRAKERWAQYLHTCRCILTAAASAPAAAASGSTKLRKESSDMDGSTESTGAMSVQRSKLRCRHALYLNRLLCQQDDLQQGFE